VGTAAAVNANCSYSGSVGGGTAPVGKSNRTSASDRAGEALPTERGGETRSGSVHAAVVGGGVPTPGGPSATAAASPGAASEGGGLGHLPAPVTMWGNSHPATAGPFATQLGEDGRSLASGCSDHDSEAATTRAGGSSLDSVGCGGGVSFHSWSSSNASSAQMVTGDVSIAALASTSFILPAAAVPAPVASTRHVGAMVAVNVDMTTTDPPRPPPLGPTRPPGGFAPSPPLARSLRAGGVGRLPPPFMAHGWDEGRGGLPLVPHWRAAGSHGFLVAPTWWGGGARRTAGMGMGCRADM